MWIEPSGASARTCPAPGLAASLVAMKEPAPIISPSLNGRQRPRSRSATVANLLHGAVTRVIACRMI
jgi:hypothetical protein